MKILIDSITEEVTKAFVDNGYDAKYGKVTLSNRICASTSVMVRWQQQKNTNVRHL